MSPRLALGSPQAHTEILGLTMQKQKFWAISEIANDGVTNLWCKNLQQWHSSQTMFQLPTVGPYTISMWEASMMWRMCRPPPDKRMHKREGVMCKLWKRVSGMAKERMLHLPKVQGGNQLQMNWAICCNSMCAKCRHLTGNPQSRWIWISRGQKEGQSSITYTQTTYGKKRTRMT